ncbi:hypothetical protein JYK22_35555, partial [Nonomuraea sp. RK-328]|nr:hypothetical protein [Nonomuraea sp. RK-328]
MPITDVHGISFTQAAGGFAAEHEELELDTRRILDAIAALGDFAGTDETGNAFRRGYSTAMQKTEKYVKALHDVYPEIAERLAGMRTTFDVAEWATIASMPQVSDPPEHSEQDGKLIP